MRPTLVKDKSDYLYMQVMQLIRDMQANGTLQPGQKLPSLRKLSANLQVSIPTVKQAYLELERQGVLHAKAKSGYYLSCVQGNHPRPNKARPAESPRAVSRQELIEDVFTAIHLPGQLALGVANPVAALPPTKALARAMRRATNLAGDQALNYGPMQGFEPLRRQLAFHYLEQSTQVDPQQITITNGAQEAIDIALQIIAKPGDVIAVESPCHFGLLELIENLGMLALELPLCADTGVDIEDIRQAINEHQIKGVLLSGTIANPLGCRLHNDKKKAIVALLEEHEIPLIEDDVWGDLCFNEKRSIPAQAFSQKGLVLTCNSFSKTIAPSYRIGWLLTPKYAARARQFKRAKSSAAPLLNQWCLHEFMQSGEYQRYLNQLRQHLLLNRDRMRALVQQHFPWGVRISHPQGGCILWLELPSPLLGDQVFQAAQQHDISLCPGSLFSPSNRYQHCIRLSYGLPWSDRLAQGIQTLGAICHRLLEEAT